MVANDVTYQHPGSSFERGRQSFDIKAAQNIKFPRDVLRYKSGTCVDLAILYASTAHSLGIKAAVVLVPGHAFPVFKLPSGKVVAVESTGVGGGSREQSMGVWSFQQAAQWGMEKDLPRTEKEPSHLVDFVTQWAKGISNPELEALPPDILRQWDYSERGKSPVPAGATQGQADASQAAQSQGQGGEGGQAAWSGIVRDHRRQVDSLSPHRPRAEDEPTRTASRARR